MVYGDSSPGLFPCPESKHWDYLSRDLSVRAVLMVVHQADGYGLKKTVDKEGAGALQDNNSRFKTWSLSS